MAELKETAGTAAGELGSLAEETTSAAKAEAARRADTAKRSVAYEVGGVASAFRKASGEFEEESLQSKAFRQLADGLSGASDSLRGKDLGELVHGLNRFAREHPATFLGAAALLGFTASRFAVASERRDHEGQQGEAMARPMPNPTAEPRVNSPGRRTKGPASANPASEVSP